MRGSSQVQRWPGWSISNDAADNDRSAKNGRMIAMVVFDRSCDIVSEFSLFSWSTCYLDQNAWRKIDIPLKI